MKLDPFYPSGVDGDVTLIIGDYVATAKRISASSGKARFEIEFTGMEKLIQICDLDELRRKVCATLGETTRFGSCGQNTSSHVEFEVKTARTITAPELTEVLAFALPRCGFQNYPGANVLKAVS